MTTIYKDPQGVQVRDFLEENEARLKDKHFLYVVGTNLEEDTYLRRHSTRGSKDGINVKIGMSQSRIQEKGACDIHDYINRGKFLNYT